MYVLVAKGGEKEEEKEGIEEKEVEAEKEEGEEVKLGSRKSR